MRTRRAVNRAQIHRTFKPLADGDGVHPRRGLATSGATPRAERTGVPGAAPYDEACADSSRPASSITQRYARAPAIIDAPAIGLSIHA